MTIANQGSVDNLACPRVDLPDNFEAFRDGIASKNTRQKLRRMWKRHFRNGDWRVTFSDAETVRRDAGTLQWDLASLDASATAAAQAASGTDPALSRRQGAYSVIAATGLILKRGHDLKNVLRVLEKKKLRLVEA